MSTDSRTFMTGSRFVGSQVMEGFGYYEYPNGSEYRGYFKDGLFHGYGLLKLAKTNTIFKGEFKNGSLENLEEMIFRDGLRVKGSLLSEDTFDTSVWKYCTTNDRRYSTELEHGQQAVGPNAYLTKNRLPPELPSDTYDTGEGIYKPSTRFVGRKSNNQVLEHFVGCSEEHDWIIHNCRKGPSATDGKVHVDLNKDSIMKILDLNIKSFELQHEEDDACTCNMINNMKHSLFKDHSNNLPTDGQSSNNSCNSFSSASNFHQRNETFLENHQNIRRQKTLKLILEQAIAAREADTVSMDKERRNSSKFSKTQSSLVVESNINITTENLKPSKHRDSSSKTEYRNFNEKKLRNSSALYDKLLKHSSMFKTRQSSTTKKSTNFVEENLTNTSKEIQHNQLIRRGSKFVSSFRAPSLRYRALLTKGNKSRGKKLK